MDRFERLAPAKINLSLQVTGKRPDGYHLLDSLVVFADIGDRLQFTPADALSLTLDGPEADALKQEKLSNNLVWRAAALLQQDAAITSGAAIDLWKVLPVAAGIGGGSADAAAALLGLNRLWQLHWPLERLQALGLTLGADVPVCLAAETCRMQGIGEQLTRCRLTGSRAILLVNPRRAVATSQIFADLTLTEKPIPPVQASYSLSDIIHWPNDLQAVACRRVPEIAGLLEILHHLPGAQLTRMSGSGATCFALFEDMQQAEAARMRVVERFPTYWVMAGSLLTA